MTPRRSPSSGRTKTEDAELGRALDAMTAPELRGFVRAVLDDMEDDQRARLVDSLISRAARGQAGWKPTRPSSQIVSDAMSFADAARRVGYADPNDTSEYLRLAAKAFLAGDHASARAVFEALLLPIATVDIDLGQHELVDDVLSVDVHACVAQYVTSVYTTTRLADRAGAVFKAIEDVKGVGSLVNPLQDMEGLTAGVLPDLGAFLPRWVKYLGRLRPSKDEWENDHERWLREAVLRLEGISGLERLARETKRPQSCLAWCETLVDRGDWAEALRAYDASATLVRQSHWRGELLDGGALVARQLGRPDMATRLETAWHAAPTLTRLLRWVAAEGTTWSEVLTRARAVLPHCPKTAGRQMGLLRVLAGDLRAAALSLLKAPGLGWSDVDHPGHLVFPLFAMLLAEGAPRPISPTLAANLESTSDDPLELLSSTGVDGKPTLMTPSIVALIQRIRPHIKIDAEDRAAMLDALRVAAEKRIEAILTHSRRRHYGHAAMLAATCVALAPKDRESELADWITGLQQTYSRRHAFRGELTTALDRLGVAV